MLRLGREGDKELAINLDHAALVVFSWDAQDNFKAVLKFVCPTPSPDGCITETIDGYAAAKLHDFIELMPELSGPGARSVLKRDELTGEAYEEPIDPKDRELELAFQPEFGADKKLVFLHTASGVS
jgi:hypothetical protein